MVDPATFLKASKLPRRVLRASEDPRYLGDSHGMTIRIVIFRLEKTNSCYVGSTKKIDVGNFLKCKLVLVE